MNKILISIRPEWIRKILNGEKTAEIRLSVPKCEFPCEVFICVTKEGEQMYTITTLENNHNYLLNGKVVAKFIMNEYKFISLNDIEILKALSEHSRNVKLNFNEKYRTCVSMREVFEYSNNRELYFWLIDSLEVFDKPRELDNFYKNKTMTKEEYLSSIEYENDYPEFIPECVDPFQVEEMEIERYNLGWELYRDYLKTRIITNIPQSWCYVSGELT